MDSPDTTAITPPASDPPPLRWGVIGTGGIAAAFVEDLTLLAGATTVAVGSRTEESAARFASEQGIARRHGSYANLAADPEVEAVYVATPHPGHHDAAMLAIDAGKAVLVEKPFTLNAAEARSLAAAARARGTFVMEAMWTRFLPHVVAIREELAAGTIGEVVSVVADHGQRFDEDASHRLFSPELGGGALLDLGVYPVSFCSMVLGPPSRVTAVGTPAFTGVDAQTSVLLEHPSGAHGVVTTTLSSRTATTAVINGTLGRIEVAGRFYSRSSFTVVVGSDDRPGEPRTFDVAGRGLRFQASEVARCVADGRTESAVLPLTESISVMDTLDEIRRQIGLTYPQER